MVKKYKHVIKGREIDFVTRLGYTDTKFTWICSDCGRVWLSREQALQCRTRKHVDAYINVFGYVERCLDKLNKKELQLLQKE